MFAVREHSVNFNVNKTISVPRNNEIVSKRDSVDTFESNTKKQISFEGIHIQSCPAIENNKIPEIINNFVDICLKMAVTNNEKTVIAAMQDAVPGLKAEYFEQTLGKNEAYSIVDQRVNNNGQLNLEAILFKQAGKNESLIIPAVHSLTSVLQSHSDKLGSLHTVMFSKMTGLDNILRLGRAWNTFEGLIIKDLNMSKDFPQDKNIWENITVKNMQIALEDQNVHEIDVNMVPMLGETYVNYLSFVAREQVEANTLSKKAYETIKEYNPNVKAGPVESADWYIALYKNIQGYTEKLITGNDYNYIQYKKPDTKSKFKFW